MRLDVTIFGVAFGVLAVATFAEEHPYEPSIHRWGLALAIALATLLLFIFSLRGLRRSRRERWAALAGVGGVVTALAFLAGELLVGPPVRVPAAPGQIYRPPSSAHVAVSFPPLDAGELSGNRSPSAVEVLSGAQRASLQVGQQMRVGSYVLRADEWPAAYVRAWSSKHVAQTVTQPAGSAFVSPVLQFPIADSDGLPIDRFAVPALHRDVRVKYYAGLPARGIDIPFLQLEIDEENGGSLFGGVAVSGRPLNRAGMQLLFDIGNYPVVSMAGSPDRLVYGTGAALMLVGVGGFAVATLRSRRERA